MAENKNRRFSILISQKGYTDELSNGKDSANP
jgi:hypothetical protein